MIDQLWEWIAVAVGLLVVLGGVLLGLVRGRARPDEVGAKPDSRDRRATATSCPESATTPPAARRPEALHRGRRLGRHPARAVGRGLPRPRRPRRWTAPTRPPDDSSGSAPGWPARTPPSGTACSTLLSRGRLDEAAWEEVEDTLIALRPRRRGQHRARRDAARPRVKVEGTTDEATVRGWLREDLLRLVDPTMDRTVVSSRVDGRPAVVLVVGVNGTGKTTTVGKLARVLVAEDKDVVLGAADTFRAAAADQLETWGARVGVPTIRSDRDGADPAAVAFDAVKAGAELEADVVLIDTAGRLHNKVGLMDELRQGQARHREAEPDRRGAARPRRHDRPERPASGGGVRRGRRRHRHRAHQARRHRQGRHRGLRAAQARRARSSWWAWARGRTTSRRSTPRPSSTRSLPEPVRAAVALSPPRCSPLRRWRVCRAAAAPPRSPRRGSAQTVDFRIEDARITESSGLALSMRHPHTVWTVNDSGDSARVFAVDTRDRQRRSGCTPSTPRSGTSRPSRSLRRGGCWWPTSVTTAPPARS